MNKTFQQLYKEKVAEPTPRQVYVAEIAAITGKSEATVKQWGNGIQTPDASSKKILGDYYRCNPDILFPKNNKQ